MRYLDTFSMSLKGLSTHKGRSALTILGIVIGITSITLVTAIGSSAEGLILSEVEGLGSNNAFVLPGRQNDFGGNVLEDSLNERDVKALQRKENVPNATYVSPLIFVPSVVSFESERRGTTVLGVTPEQFTTNNLIPALGGIFDEEDVNQSSDVVVLGSKITEELFGSTEVLNEKIKIKDKNYRIIGVLTEKGQSPFINFDDVVMMPITTAQQYVAGFKHYQRIIVTGNDPDQLDSMIRDIEATLRDSHGIENPDDDDFFVNTQQDIANTFSTITTIMTVLLTSVAAISLVVGGVGIMNIMLVSVTERTREIGLRKALGARNSDILLQFLTEAVVLTIAGGVLGIALGLGLSYGATVLTKQFFDLSFPFIIPINGMVLGVVSATLIGFIFGIYPARQAASRSPMEALRYE